MTRIERSIIIEAPIKDVFSYAADWRKWSDWFEGVSNFKATTEVEQGNGARYAYKARMMGISAKVETEIHDFVRDKGWTGIATKGMPHRTYWIFESIGDKTKFTYALEYKLPLPFLGSLLDSLIMKPQWERIIGNSLKNLRGHFLSQQNTI
jgi:coenzyme Q-binding protein COQ10